MTTNFKNITKTSKIVGTEPNLKIKEIYDIHTPKETYSIYIGDEIIDCSGNHLWYAETEYDMKYKDRYLELANKYFEHPPDWSTLKLDLDMEYPLSSIVLGFSRNIEEQEFIERVALSLGHTSEANDGIFMVDGKGKPGLELYNCRDFLNFIKKMEKTIKTHKGYFYFGQVYKTSVLATLDCEINIPTIEEIQKTNF